MGFEPKYAPTKANGDGNLVNILANGLARTEKNSKIRMIDTPETVYRVMCHPEFRSALERGVHFEVLLVQTDDPYQKPYLEAIRDGKAVIAMDPNSLPQDTKNSIYAGQLAENYQKGGVEAVADFLTQTMKINERPISRKVAMEMARESEKRIYGHTLKYKAKQFVKKVMGKD